MKTSLLILVLGTLIIATSCNKEVFPDRETLVGKWIVKDGPNDVYVEFTLWNLSVVNGNHLEYHYSPLNSTMYIYPDKYNNPDKFSTHAIYFNEKKNELRIRNILKEYGDGSGFTTFKKQ